MIRLLECLAAVGFVAGNLMVWSCVLVAGWSEKRVNELRGAGELDVLHRQYFKFGER